MPKEMITLNGMFRLEDVLAELKRQIALTLGQDVLFQEQPCVFLGNRLATDTLLKEVQVEVSTELYPAYEDDLMDLCRILIEGMNLSEFENVNRCDLKVSVEITEYNNPEARQVISVHARFYTLKG